MPPAAAAAAPAHLISRVGDPLFALFIGLGAAATRVNREEKEAGRSTRETLDAGLRRMGFLRREEGVFEGQGKGKEKGSGNGER
ncbi:uncharacterized protein L3040_006530 [Drepanopeziza brunnea f. sp. 'multigermtubi']|uniref:Non-classical export protein 1 n=1 Tax=Marssonina brunnea f. sp. multigermtubi (strain MB_m1) TaxID=1072389 RepID=K1XDU8_MARBU|nr:uncharacterized protein MBM_02275 [Drepanopeziza brunnea f. sp. 'multigermtubi' MB_m1]EKD19038.1 hypothetical protein MBM_02275 [Drepanopeziza brunnea f. sp. 'multigermtubi' MB_m1]KAJ5038851.1 hypothetical protein L3040_006530 [Drepanopeziza brunnea f. sp. 'multigermtubi']